MHPLISSAELAARLDDPMLRIYDCTTFLHPQPNGGPMRVETGRRLYAEPGHIPGAALIELQEDLSDPTNRLRFSMPSTQDLTRMFTAKGIGDGTEVVLYTAGDAWWATRVWWMLRALGFNDAAVLDGGLRKWIAEGRPLTKASSSYPPGATLSVRPRELFTDRDGVLKALDDGSALVVNCLRKDLHDGTAPYHYGRPGHISGSVNAPAGSLFEKDGTFKTPAQLRAFFSDCGIVPGRNVIAYCGGGIAATGDAFALTALLDQDGVLVYDNSLQEWANDPTLPMTAG